MGIEDLEAEQVSGKKGRKANKKHNASSNKKGNNFLRGSSAEREDSEEENLGGQVSF